MQAPTLGFTVLCLGLLSSPALFSQTDAAAEAAGARPLQIHQSVEPSYPSSTMLAGIATGDVKVAIEVDASGQLTDTLVLAYTNGAFMRSAVDALREWSYTPAMVDGEARAATGTVTFHFQPNGVVLAEITGDSPNPLADFVQENQQTYEYRISDFRDLDRIPTPIKVARPVVPAGVHLADQSRVTVTFYIDQQGRVRMPSVSRADDNALGWAAVAAVAGWQFAPPTVNGSPVVVAATQDIIYGPSKQ